ncbi:MULTISPECIES: LacI family DNA-binding transcriptional regulator [unclassified Gilliamella]|uniref:LacI family DNA-binding transcriptional regulator n=1 Tax=unclassified Gilliamella TaxID=2685620 RepID=UPI001306F8CC|nr:MULTISPECIES: LacI family DNA-binding transcriptional regulator [unclassified Gilliamella]MWP49046.1 LacI family DNA-binding transcriptional regulator [Gilliamella sp. Lep-s35]MWP68873.1 LacI family DNA-binding transcriptional regulator [Gilliamella sp. Lep-s5]MWP76903.1 LacI family DNA-binding transcriptional regulator [Gilliamella sp. Lep-s21]
MTKITLSTIAKKANTSVASVSRVLKKPHLTSPQIQLRVYQAIEELNMDTSKNFKPYKPIHNSGKILIIDNQLYSKSLINAGLELVLKEEQFQMFYLQFPYHNKTDIHHIIRYVAQHAFDGIIIINDAPYLKTLVAYKTTLPPIVLVNHFSLDFICVDFDHLLIGHQITKYLIDKSHTKIAILLNNEKLTSSTLLLQGYKQALMRANITIEPRYIIHGCFTYQHARSAVKKLINGTKSPSAIICTDNFSLNCLDKSDDKDHNQSPDSMILGAVHQANESQSKLTKPLTISYFSSSKELKYNQLDTLSRINKPLFEMGQKSATLLCELIKSTAKPTKRCKIIEAESIFY